MHNLLFCFGGRARSLLLITLFTFMVTGCASMQPVMDSMKASLPKLPTSQPATANSGPARPAPSVDTTPLVDLFKDKPVKANPYPRLAITVTHLPVEVRSRSPGVFAPEAFVVSGCWTMTATLWSDAKHSTAISEFSVCPQDQPRYAMSHAYEWGSGPTLPGTSPNTGSVRTQGPVPPSTAMPHDAVLDVHRTNLDDMLVVVFYKLGFDYVNYVDDDRRLWFVSFNESQLK